MARKYSKEEKQEHLKKFKISGKSKGAYAKENGIPETTFRLWTKNELEEKFGTIEMEELKHHPENIGIAEPIVFSDKYIKIELRDGYSKEALKQIVEVITR